MRAAKRTVRQLASLPRFGIAFEDVTYSIQQRAGCLSVGRCSTQKPVVRKVLKGVTAAFVPGVRRAESHGRAWLFASLSLSVSDGRVPAPRRSSSVSSVPPAPASLRCSTCSARASRSAGHAQHFHSSAGLTLCRALQGGEMGGHVAYTSTTPGLFAPDVHVRTVLAARYLSDEACGRTLSATCFRVTACGPRKPCVRRSCSPRDCGCRPAPPTT
jgi:hypothetical protein